MIGTNALSCYDWLTIRRYMHKHGWNDWDCDCMAKHDDRMIHAEWCSVTPIFASMMSEVDKSEWPLW
jgi:hypothetical protein